MRLPLFVMIAWVFGIGTLTAHEVGRSRVDVEPQWNGVLAAGNPLLRFRLIDKKTNNAMGPDQLKVEYEHKLHVFVFDPTPGVFEHVQPIYRENSWQLTVRLRTNGRYWMWIQGVIQDENEEFASAVQLEVRGGSALPARSMFRERREGREGESVVSISGETFYEDEEATPVLSFSRANSKTRPGLRQFLGTWAHVVIVSGDGSHFLKARVVDATQPSGEHHARHLSRMPPHTLEILRDSSKRHLLLHVEFPIAGEYRVWVQFNDNGHIRTIALDLRVDPEVPVRAQEPDWPQTLFNYIPGRALTWAEYQRHEREYNRAESRVGFSDSLAILAREIEKETLPALLYTFTHRLSVVSYEDFTDPEVRHRARYARNSRDDAAGLRVVWIMNVAMPGNPRDRRRISIILFYDFDFDSKRFRLITEEDAMRVRVEIERLQHGEGIIGLSYIVRFNQDNRVTALEPGIYVHNNGELRDARFTDFAQPEHCTMCHRTRSTYLGQRDLQMAYDNDFGQMRGYRDFLTWLRRRDGNPRLLDYVQGILSRPKRNFRPEGMVEAIQRRMENQNR